MSGPRVLIPLTYGFSVRYAVPTGLLAQLAAVCTPVVGLSWEDPELRTQLEAEGFEVVRLPEVVASHAYRNHTRRMDLVHQRRLQSPTTRIRRARWKRRGLTRLRMIEEGRSLGDRLALARPGGVQAILDDDDRMATEETNVDVFAAYLRAERIDAVLSFTPYHDHDVLSLIAAKREGLVTLVSIISFDNPTIRGRLPVDPDLVMVWSHQNADQVARSHPGIDPAAVRVVGAPQFDLHRQERLVMDEASWRGSLGLPPDRPIVLYGAGASRLVPEEHRLVDLLDAAVADGRIPGRPFVLVRRHPVDPPEPWSSHAARWRHAAVVAPWASAEAPMRSWPSLDDLRVQMSSLAHSSVHINVCSSMTVDGAMFDRPQIGPAFLPGASRLQQRFVRDFYRQEHWAPIAASGGLTVARDEAELIAAVREALDDPARLAANRTQLIEGVLTWPDGRSVERLVAQVGAAISG
jgi:hypothetical protein